ncbi:porin family protein [Vibrio sp. S9_S30]|uniref:outer membrane beta-barrel protein n=1 Tax=Vibrio sp. S9_S30 TaxID=2720226 RepID=UPI0016802ED1|nr:outer membrane beta-barrel protein [Vibrio sp. S9_S30]MBD1559846.1 porin family protein [Vibrio sp. S9_S30]
MKNITFLLAALLSTSTFGANHYVGIKLGGAAINNDDTDDAGIAVQFEYAYQFHTNFSAEIGYATASGVTNAIVTGALTDSTETFEYDATFAGLKANIAPTDFINFYAMGGVSHSDLQRTLKPKSGGAETVEHQKGVNPYFGGGAEIILLDTFSLSLDYRRFMFENSYYSDTILAGLNFRF